MPAGLGRVKASFQPGASEANLLLGASGTRPGTGFQAMAPHPHRPLKALDNKGKHPEKGELFFLPLQPQPCSHIEADLMTFAKLAQPEGSCKHRLSGAPGSGDKLGFLGWEGRASFPFGWPWSVFGDHGKSTKIDKIHLNKGVSR